MKLPKEIFVKMNEDNDEGYLEAYASIADFEDGDKIGIYNLVSKKTVKVTVDLK
mgnify:CR=1 FL=1